tara:strand:- start:448 stop:651 length:204 start_codon:yes stop_codon:yes gene_type:complete
MADLYLSLQDIESDKEKLVADFNDLKEKLQSMETSMNAMRNNLNALSGAIQQSDKLIKMTKEKKNKK